MAAGTISLTNGSTTVNGTGTSFATELKPGDFIYVTVGGAPYTLVASSVSSNSQLSLAVAFDGPSSTGLAWNAVPASLQVAITQKILNDFASVARGRILDFQNWQKIYSSEASVTVTRPDRTTFTGPSWGYVASQYANKLDKEGGAMTGSLFLPALEITSPTPFIDFHFQSSPDDYTARIIHTEKNALEINAGSGAISFRVNGGMRVGNPNIGGGINIFRGNGNEGALWGLSCGDGNFNFARGAAAGGNVHFGLSVLTGHRGIHGLQGQNGAAFGQPYNWYWNGSNLEAWVGVTQIGSLVGNATSDRQLKKDIEYRSDTAGDLAEVLQWRPATFKMKERGIVPESDDTLGFIANDLVIASPECVNGKGLPDDYDIVADPNNPDAYSLNVVAMVAKLTHAIQAQQKQLMARDSAIEELQKRLKALDGLDA
ncbi:tail fiber domain-containing protein [Pantoea sp. Mb-10]|uniref:tail fiber domain-containing protein n=1 Tax=unclassified Pantoea TaxID=2630326 RepID=UPI001E2E3ACE|nr:MULTISPECIES: tail fiber domain-containing protein [unclassified Pantoea]MCE0491005.1 tail fiber domain-containing protein [Pantoea sp. Mb-10]MCE0499836.1 tail fiber domain-containing protein [Pantoea sp. Pb-8]